MPVFLGFQSAKQFFFHPEVSQETRVGFAGQQEGRHTQDENLMVGTLQPPPQSLSAPASETPDGLWM